MVIYWSRFRKEVVLYGRGQSTWNLGQYRGRNAVGIPQKADVLFSERSHYDTITIGPEGKFNWVLQLINSQKIRLFDSLEEKVNTKRFPNQPNQSQNQSVIDRGNLRTRKVCLLLKVKRPVPTRSMIKVFTKNSVLQIDQGNLIICLKTPVLSKLTMDQGNLMSVTAQEHTQ